MPKVTLANVASLNDPLTSSLYALHFYLPEGVVGNLETTAGEGVSGSKLLTIACQAVTLPAKTIAPNPLEVHGHTLRFTGKVSFDGTLTVSFVETRNMAIYNQLYNWQAACKDIKSQLGLYKSEYQTEARLEVFDNKGIPQSIFLIKNMWISGLPDVAFDQNDTLITLSCTFAFDWIEREMDAEPVISGLLDTGI